MSLIDQINADFKQAMLNHDDFAKVVLNGLKSAIKYREVELKAKGKELDEAEILAVVAKEAKSRADAIALYESAGDDDRADHEKRERDIIVNYLPKQLTADELREVVMEVIAGGDYQMSDMGKVIGQVKAKVGVLADGASVASMVKECLAK